MLDCSGFLDGYSDYRDGRLGPQARAIFLSHLSTCTACARYDSVVRRGVEMLRSISEVEPSVGFRARLRYRIGVVERMASASGSSLAAPSPRPYPFLHP